MGTIGEKVKRGALVFSILMFSIVASAKEKSPEPQLRDYILPPEEVEKLKPAEQMTYFVFLQGLNAVLETSQAYNRVRPKTSAQQELQKGQPLFASIEKWALMNRAHAVLPAVIAVGGRALMVARPAIQRAAPVVVRTVKDYSKRTANFFKKRNASDEVAEEFISARASEAAVKAAQRAGRAQGALAGTTAMSAIYALGGMVSDSTPLPQRDAKALAPQKAEVTGAMSDAVPAGPYKEIGSPCIFAGHRSEYVDRGEGRLLCARPEKELNAEGCRGTTEEPKIRCNSFGLMTGPTPQGVKEATCVSYYPLDDLTVRCTEKILGWMEKNPPTHLDTEEYSKWREGILSSIADFEKNFGEGVRFAQYCANGNAINNGLQKNECAALNNLISMLKKQAPGVTMAVNLNARGIRFQRTIPPPKGGATGKGAEAVQ